MREIERKRKRNWLHKKNPMREIEKDAKEKRIQFSKKVQRGKLDGRKKMIPIYKRKKTNLRREIGIAQKRIKCKSKLPLAKRETGQTKKRILIYEGRQMVKNQ